MGIQRVGKCGLAAACGLLAIACSGADAPDVTEPVGETTAPVQLQEKGRYYELVTPFRTIFENIKGIFGNARAAEQGRLMGGPTRARGAVRTRIMDATCQNQLPAPEGRGQAASCGVTFISPNYGITAAHCVAEGDVFGTCLEIIDVQMFRPGIFLESFFQGSRQVTGTFPNYTTTQLGTGLIGSIFHGYGVDSYRCTVAARCGAQWGPAISCDNTDAHDNNLADVALLNCEGAPGERYGFVPISMTDTPGATVGAAWAHEVYDIPPTNADLFEHYTRSTADHAQNFHYWEGFNQLFGLVSLPWPDSQPRLNLGSQSTELLGCHGTSGSGFLQLNGTSFELLGPARTAGAAIGNERLCSESASFTKGMNGLTFSPLVYTQFIAQQVPLQADCTQWARRQRVFRQGGLGASCRRLPVGPEPPVPFEGGTSVPRAALGPHSEAQTAVLVHGGVEGTAFLGEFTTTQNLAYRVSGVGRGTANCSSEQTVCSRLTVRVGGVPVLVKEFRAPDTGRLLPLYGNFTAPVSGVVSVEIHATGGVEVSDLSVVPENHGFSLNDGFTLGDVSTFARFSDGTSMGPLPARWAGDSADGFAAVLNVGERLVFTGAAVGPSHRFWLKFKASARQGLRCGYLDASSQVVSSFACSDDRATRFDAGSAGAFLYVEKTSGSDIVEIDGVSIASDTAPDGDADGVPDGVDDCPNVPNPAQNGCGDFRTFALYAERSLRIGDRVNVRDGAGLAPVACAGTLGTQIGTDALIGNVFSEGNVTVGDRSRVEGKIRTEGSVTFGSGALATGGVSPSVLNWQPLSSFEATFPSGTFPDVIVPPDTERAIAAGSFRDVTVFSRSRLTLTAGTYFMRSLTLEPQSTLVLPNDGTVTVRVRDAFTYRGAIEGTDAPRRLSVIYQGTSATPIEAPFSGRLVATRGVMLLRGTPGPHVGSFLGREIDVQPGTFIGFIPTTQ